MIKSSITVQLVAALSHLLLFLPCRIELASALVNIHRPRASKTIRWTTDDRGQAIIQSLHASEEALTDTDTVYVDEDAKKKNPAPLEAAIIEQPPPHQAWKPPSQNTRGGDNKIFKIQQPQDLLNFVIEDERLSIVKVYASWCKTCKVFDVRYRKLANQMSDDPVRFAEMQYDTPANEEMCKLLNATKLPYVLIYRGSKGKVADFQCTPATFQVLIDTVNGLLSDENGGVHNSTTASSSSSSDSQQRLGNDDSSSNEDEVDNLKEQLVTMENERLKLLN
ncbi:hypothetical protein ACHAXM_002332 [Skeletonema potamos]